MAKLLKLCKCCVDCWKGVQPKYKQLILNLYPNPEADAPDAEAAPKAGAVSALTFYALRFPKKLPLMGKYMLKRIRADTNLNRFNNVQIMTMALGALVDACHSDLATLTLYDEYVLAAITHCLSHPNVDLKVLGSIVFIKVIKYQDENSEFKKFEPFFSSLANLCTFNDDRADRRHKVRLAGLRAIAAMLRYNESHRLAAHFEEIIPAIMQNLPDDLSNPPPEMKDDDEKGLDSPQLMAHSCFTAVAATPVPNVTQLLDPIFRHLDVYSWLPEPFSLQCLQQVASYAQMRNADLLVHHLLRHTDNIGLDHGPSNVPVQQKREVAVRDTPAHIRTRIINVTSGLLLGSARLEIGPWQGFIGFLLGKLESVQNVMEDPDYEQFEAAVARFIAACSRKVHNSTDSLEIVLYILQQYRSDVLSPLTRKGYNKCMLRVAQLIRPLPAGVLFPEVLLVRILRCLQVETETPLRCMLYDLIAHLLLPTEAANTDAALVLNGDDTKFARFMRVFSSGGAADNALRVGNPGLTDLHRKYLQTQVFLQLTSDSLSPHLCWYSLRVLIVLLYHSPAKELQAQVPMMFALLDYVSRRKGAAQNVPDVVCDRCLECLLSHQFFFALGHATLCLRPQARSNGFVLSVVALYLMCVARIFSMLERAPEARRAASQLEELLHNAFRLNGDLDTLSAESIRGDVDISFEKGDLLQHLSQLSSAESGSIESTSLREILSRPFENQEMPTFIHQENNESRTDISGVRQRDFSISGQWIEPPDGKFESEQSVSRLNMADVALDVRADDSEPEDDESHPHHAHGLPSRADHGHDSFKFESVAEALAQKSQKRNNKFTDFIHNTFEDPARADQLEMPTIDPKKKKLAAPPPSLQVPTSPLAFVAAGMSSPPNLSLEQFSNNSAHDTETDAAFAHMANLEAKQQKRAVAAAYADDEDVEDNESEVDASPHVDDHHGLGADYGVPQNTLELSFPPLKTMDTFSSNAGASRSSTLRDYQ